MLTKVLSQYTLGFADALYDSRRAQNKFTGSRRRRARDFTIEGRRCLLDFDQEWPGSGHDNQSRSLGILPLYTLVKPQRYHCSTLTLRSPPKRFSILRKALNHIFKPKANLPYPSHIQKPSTRHPKQDGRITATISSSSRAISKASTRHFSLYLLLPPLIKSIILTESFPELQTSVEARQKLESQQQENKGVQKVWISVHSPPIPQRA